MYEKQPPALYLDSLILAINEPPLFWPPPLIRDPKVQLYQICIKILDILGRTGDIRVWGWTGATTLGLFIMRQGGAVHLGRPGFMGEGVWMGVAPRGPLRRTKSGKNWQKADELSTFCEIIANFLHQIQVQSANSASQPTSNLMLCRCNVLSTLFHSTLKGLF